MDIRCVSFGNLQIHPSIIKLDVQRKDVFAAKDNKEEALMMMIALTAYHLNNNNSYLGGFVSFVVDFFSSSNIKLFAFARHRQGKLLEARMMATQKSHDSISRPNQ